MQYLVIGIITNRLQQVLEPLDITLTYEPISASASPPAEATESTHPPEILPYEIIFYVGGESLGLTNLLITNSSCDVIHLYKTIPMLLLK